MKKSILISIVSLASLVAGTVYAGRTAVVSAEQWEAYITADDGSARARVSLGMQPTATDGFDRAWDVKAMLGYGVRAYVHRTDWPAGNYYSRTVGAPQYPASYEFVVDRGQAEVSLSWDLRHLPTGCERVDLYLVDSVTNTRVDMRLNDAYGYASDGSARAFRVDANLVVTPTPGVPDLQWVRLIGRDVLLRWTAPNSGAVAPAGYNVYRQGADGAVRKLNAEPVFDLFFTDRSPLVETTGTRYFVRAVSRELCEGEPTPAQLIIVPGGRR